MKPILILTLFLSSFVIQHSSFAAQRPNLVLILADDLGYTDTGCYGATKVKTPNIDRLAKEGVRFTDAHSPAAVCSPSRYSLLTGEYPFRNPAASKKVMGLFEPLAIAPGQPTIASLAKSKGYTTGIVGKWHVGMGRTEVTQDTPPPDFNGVIDGSPLDVGFDECLTGIAAGVTHGVLVENGRIFQADPADPFEWKLKQNRWRLSGGEKARSFDKPNDVPVITQRAVEFIERHQKRPFLLCFTPFNVHTPIRPGAKFAGKSGCGPYGDFIQELDWMVGQVLDALDRCGLTENTLVFFSSDNGGGYYKPEVEEALKRGHRVNGNLLGQKTDIWEGGHRVPFIVRWPGKVPPGVTSDALVSLTDVMATLADLWDASIAGHAAGDSVSFLPVLTGESHTARESLIYQGFETGLTALREGPWVYVPAQGSDGDTTTKGKKKERMMSFAELGLANSDYTPDGKLKPGSPPGQLYNLKGDLSQRHNLYDQHPERVAQMKARLELIKSRKAVSAVPERGPASTPAPPTAAAGTLHNVFASPVDLPDPENIHGEPALAWHDGEFFLFYDLFPSAGPLYLMTSKDGVYWKEEGPALHGDTPEHRVECADIRRFDPDGPFVMSYDTRIGKGEKQTRFATSRDLRHWEKVKDAAIVRDPKLYEPMHSYVHYSIADPDGKGFYAIGAYTPATHLGTGLLRSEDGIDWEQLPGPRVTGIPDQARGLFDRPGLKAIETAGITRIGDRWFILGINPLLHGDAILAATDIRGPYSPPPKNPVLPRDPSAFNRLYNLPQGVFSMPLIKLPQDDGTRRSYFSPLRKVASDGESIWLKWWEGNEALKSHPLPAKNGFVTCDLAKGVVLEATLPLPSREKMETHWARDAAATASADNVWQKSYWDDGLFAASKAHDGREHTAWIGHRKGGVETVNFSLDLGAVRPVGRVRVLWHTRPSGIVLQSSRDGKTWQDIGGKPWRYGTRVTLWESLNTEARHLRLVCTIAERRHNRKNPEEHIAGISEIEVHPEPVERIAAHSGGLVAKSKSGDDLAWLVETGGRVRFGQLDSEGHFRCIRTRDLEIDLGERVTLRLVARDRLAELYVNDHLVDDYDITGCAGKFTVLSAEPATLHAWQPDPKAAPSK
jgi:arylsulfatase A-like enzyme